MKLIIIKKIVSQTIWCRIRLQIIILTKILHKTTFTRWWIAFGVGERLTAIDPISTSEPELISAETLLSRRANVTFFSSFGSLMVRSTVADVCEPVFSENVVSFISLSESIVPARTRFSDNEINSPIFILGLAGLAAGETNCCRICFFSAAFFFTGVELLRFLRGDGEPVRVC